MSERSRMDEERAGGAEPYELLFLALFFGLGGVLLIASGVFGLPGLGVAFSEPVVAALAGGVVVLLPMAFVLLFVRREHRRSLDRLERDVADRLVAMGEQVGEAVELWSEHARALSRFHERALSSHAFQEEAQDRMEASHERQEARLLAMEQRLDDARLGDVDERLSDLVARQEALFARVLEGEGSKVEGLVEASFEETGGGGGLGQPASAPVSTYAVEEVPGVGGEEAKALSRIGIRVTDTLLYADPSLVSRDSGLDRERVEAWRLRAEVMGLIEGVDPEMAALLVEHGVGSIRSLARLGVDDLVEIVCGSSDDGSRRRVQRRCEGVLEEAGRLGEGVLSERAAV